MAVKKFTTRIQLKNDTNANWTTGGSLVLLKGEFAWDSTNKNFKIGDGSTAFSSLPYVIGSSVLAGWTADTTSSSAITNGDSLELALHKLENKVDAAAIGGVLSIGGATGAVTVGNGLTSTTGAAGSISTKVNGYIVNNAGTNNDALDIDASKVDSAYTVANTTNLATVATVTAALDTLDVTEYAQASVSTSAFTVSGISETNGKIAVGANSVSLQLADSYDASTNKVATVATVTNAIAALDTQSDVQPVVYTAAVPGASGAKLTFKGVSETDGVIAQGSGNTDLQFAEVATTGAAGDVTTTAITDGDAQDPQTLYAAGNVQGTLEAIARDLNAATAGAVNDVKIGTDSIVTNHVANIATEGTYDASTNKIATESTVSDAIEALDVTEFALGSKDANNVITLKGIKEDDGEIAAGTNTSNDIVFAAVAATGAAGDVTYSNTSSGLTATNVQSAIDELDGAIDALSSATHFLGVSTTAITNGGSESPTIGGSTVTPSNGDIVIYQDKEFVYATADNQWHELGDQALYMKDVKVNGNSIKSSQEADLAVDGTYNSSSNKIASQTTVSTAIAALDTTNDVTIASQSGKAVTIAAGIAEEDGIIKAGSGTAITLADVASTGNAEDVVYDNTTSGLQADDVQAAIDEVNTKITNANITIDGHKGAITTGNGITDVTTDGGSFALDLDNTNANGLYLSGNTDGSKQLAMHIADESTASGANFGTVKVTDGNGLSINNGVVSYAHNTTAINIATKDANDIITVQGTLTPDASDAITTSNTVTFAKVAATGSANDVTVTSANYGGSTATTNLQTALTNLATSTEGAVQDVKTLKTSTTAQSVVAAGETLEGTGDITLHQISKTGNTDDLIQGLTLVFDCGTASTVIDTEA